MCSENAGSKLYLQASAICLFWPKIFLGFLGDTFIGHPLSVVQKVAMKSFSLHSQISPKVWYGRGEVQGSFSIKGVRAAAA